MPVTKTAKRALRSSKRKEAVNKIITSQLEIAIKKARKVKTLENVKKAISLADIAAKKKIIHKNKAAHIKSMLSKLAKPKKTAPKTAKKTKKTK